MFFRPCVLKSLTFAGLVLGSTLLASIQDERLPVPDAEARQNSSKLLRALYGQDLDAAKTAPLKAALAKKLGDEAVRLRHKTDSYALLIAANNIAIKIGDVQLLRRNATVISDMYEVSRVQYFAESLLAVDPEVLSTTSSADWAEAALELVAEAIQGEDFQLASRLVQALMPNARKARDPKLVARTTAISNVVNEYKAIGEAESRARGVLAGKPDDAEACLHAGRYSLLVRRDWATAFTYLAKGSDPKLKAIAEHELSPPIAGNDIASLADLWRDLAATSEGILKTVATDRARTWYVAARNKVTGLELLRVEKCLSELSPVTVPRPVEKLQKAATPSSNMLTNSIGMRLVFIPAGDFLMGSLPSEAERHAIEYPHRVRVSRPFYLGAFEVTQGEFEQVMGTNPSGFNSKTMSIKGVAVDTSSWPVDGVTWHEAVEFCQRLSALPKELAAGRRYRLPTEAEWEYACRAGSTTPYHFGSALNGDQANCDGTHPYGTRVKGRFLARTTAVGAYRPNAWGLYDMHGNVIEWCFDWYDPGYYRTGVSVDPQGPRNGDRRVLRGGAFGNFATCVRAAFRDSNRPDVRNNNYGFRVALTTPVDNDNPISKSR